MSDSNDDMAAAAALFEEFQETEETRMYDLRCCMLAGNWITADDVNIPITDMESSHIRNSIAMIRREKIEPLEDYVPLFEDELRKRHQALDIQKKGYILYSSGQRDLPTAHDRKVTV